MSATLYVSYQQRGQRESSRCDTLVAPIRDIGNGDTYCSMYAALGSQLVELGSITSPEYAKIRQERQSQLLRDPLSAAADRSHALTHITHSQSHTHMHSLSLVLVAMMKSKELKAKSSDARSLILSRNTHTLLLQTVHMQYPLLLTGHMHSRSLLLHTSAQIQ